MNNPPHPAGLYIHIPFCASKCAYCDFLSFAPEGVGWCAAGEIEARKNAALSTLMTVYTRALVAELRHGREGEYKNTLIDTVYIGGGTPTALPVLLLCEVIAEARRFHLTPGAEITVEMNPVTGCGDYLAALRAAGVNRLSLGLQAWQDDLLARIGRTHKAEDFTRTFRAAREAGFTNINVDLMFALPGQTLTHWHESLAAVIALGPAHISAYSLTPAEGTPLWDALQRGEITLPDDETDRAMYRAAGERLAAAGYTRYEISNYARPGYESRHNVNTWRRRPYGGFGLGAHALHVSEDKPHGVRSHNTEDIHTYLKAWGSAPAYPYSRENITPLTSADAMSEWLILGLRLTEGVCEKEFAAAFGTPLYERYRKEIDALLAKGLLQRANQRLSLTEIGTDFANQVMREFI